MLKELLPYIIIIVVVVLIRSFIITFVTVNGPSMETTLYGNDIMLLNKINKNNIKFYDIVVFSKGKDKLIKRAIGLPGDKVKCVSGVVYVNNEEIDDHYAHGKTNDFGEVILQNDEYFLMGDNRENSLDSRSFGPVKKDHIIGTTDLIIFPFNHFKKF